MSKRDRQQERQRKNRPQQEPAGQPTVMVTGGAGFIGQHVLRHLLDEGQAVVTLYHHRLPETHDQVFPVCSDMGSAELLAAPLRGIETVVHLAWEGELAGSADPVKWEPSTNTNLTRNLQTTHNLLTAMERAGTKRIVFVSAVGASRHAKAPFLREKYAAEFMILNSRVPEKIILRSAIVWSAEDASDKFLRSITRVMKYPLYPVPKKKEGLSPLHVNDLTDLIVAASEHELSEPAAVLDIVGGENYKVEELFKIVSDNYLKKSRFGIGGFLGDSLLPFFERDPRKGPKTQKLQLFLALGSQVDDQTRKENPLVDMLPERLTTFKEKLTNGGAKTLPPAQ
jgi:nucleoside-diphosphate-sugar epimerase